jgi:hypothetical protein
LKIEGETHGGGGKAEEKKKQCARSSMRQRGVGREEGLLSQRQWKNMVARLENGHARLNITRFLAY